jgi:hypothetical protein
MTIVPSSNRRGSRPASRMTGSKRCRNRAGSGNLLGNPQMNVAGAKRLPAAGQDDGGRCGALPADDLGRRHTMVGHHGRRNPTMITKNPTVSLTEPVIGNHGGDLDHSSVRYRTIEAIERLFLPVSTFAVPSGQHMSCCLRDVWFTPGRTGRGSRTSVWERQAADSRAVADWEPSRTWTTGLSPMERLPRSQDPVPPGILTGLRWGSDRCAGQTIKDPEGRSRRRACATRPRLPHSRSRRHGPVDPGRGRRTHR